MNVKLIVPPKQFLNSSAGMFPIPSLALANLGSYLISKGYEVDVIDFEIILVRNKKKYDYFNSLVSKISDSEFDDYFLNNKLTSEISELSELIMEDFGSLNYDAFGFSILESSAVNLSLLIAKNIKRNLNKKIIFGGFFANPDFTKKYDFVDFSSNDGGEVYLLEAVEFDLKSGNLDSVSSNGLHLDERETPDFSLMNLDLYKTNPEHNLLRNVGEIIIFSYLWGRGCPYNCSFCSGSIYTDQNTILRSSKKVVADLKKMSRDYGAKYFLNLNEYFHMDSAQIKEICEGIISEKLDLLWAGCSRANIDTRMIPLLREAGLRFVTCGLESTSDRILKLMRKGYNSEIAQSMLDTLYAHNIWSAFFLLVNFPTESEDEFMETFNFVKNNISKIDLCTVSFFRLNDSYVYRNPNKFGIRILDSQDSEDHIDNFAYEEIGGLSWDDLKKRGEYRRKKILKLFDLHGRPPFKYVNSSMHDMFYGYTLYEQKSDVWNFIQRRFSDYQNRLFVELNLGSKCNNNCSVCNGVNCISKKEGLRNYFDLSEFDRALEYAKKNNIKYFVLGGKEPLLNKSLSSVLKRLNDYDFDIILKTNARILSQKRNANILFNAGIKTIIVPIFGVNSQEHDAVTRVENSFRQTLNGIKNFKQVGGFVKVRSHLSKNNLDNISDYIDLILKCECGDAEQYQFFY